MSKLHIRPIRIRKYFPLNDNLAAEVARLCILLEDFRIEAKGIVENKISSLEGVSFEYRRNYFFRNAFKSLHEIRITIHTIRINPEFKEAFNDQDCETKRKFIKHKKRLDGTETLLKNFRNNLGGHVLNDAVSKGLAEIDEFDTGLIQVSDTMENTHFKFVDNIVIGSLLSLTRETDNISDKSLDETGMKFLSDKLQEAISGAIILTEMIFSIYVKHRKLA